MSEYWRELRTEWRAVSSATIGLASGLVMNSYALGIMGPHLVKDLHWSKADLAGVQILSLTAILIFPVIGRLGDAIGVRATASIGVFASPMLFLALSMMSDIRTYMVLFSLQLCILATTTPAIYCRIVVQHFNRARGLALAFAAAGPAFVAAVGGPLLNNFVVEHGWRAGFLAVGVFSVIGGGIAIFLMPTERREAAPQAERQSIRIDYPLIFRSRAFWLLAGSMLFCNLPAAAMLTQLNLIIAEHGVVDKAAAFMVSAYATGMLIGRFISGAALDRFSAPVVATICLALSAVGIFALAIPSGSSTFLLISILLVGLSFGAETDIIGYLVYRSFGTRLYSSVYGILSGINSGAAAIGGGMMSVALARTGSYSPFLYVSSALVLAGSLLFLFLPKARTDGDGNKLPA